MASLVILGIVGSTEVILIVILLFALVFALRTFGAWMFRIDEVIRLQKQILEELKKKIPEK